MDTHTVTVNDKAVDAKQTIDPGVNKLAMNDYAAYDSALCESDFGDLESGEAATYDSDTDESAVGETFTDFAAEPSTTNSAAFAKYSTTNPRPLTDLALLSLNSTHSYASSIVNISSDSRPQSLTDSTTYLTRTEELLRQDLAVAIADRKLESVLSDQMSELHITKRPDPFADLVCAFGFTGELEEPDPMPTSKAAFLIKAQAELEKAVSIQRGLKSYYNEIETGRYHVFSAGFLEHEKAATITTCQQLNDIRAHIVEVIQEVNGLDDEDAEVTEDLRIAYSHARPWIVRTRAILVNSHVFYKINYVIGSEKKF